MTKVRGLTLIRPWGSAVAYMGKDVENRTWNCYLSSGDFIAIHNGKSWDNDAVNFIEQATGQGYPKLTNDVVPDSCIIAIARFGGNVTESDSAWFCGPVGWKLERVLPIDPVPCKGRQGLWNLPDDVLPVVRKNYAQAIQEAA